MLFQRGRDPVILLAIPVELRLLIYDFYLDDARRILNDRQPANAHYSLLHTCRLLYQEAGYILRQYVSLRNERQIDAFLQGAGPHLAQLRWVDVASDGRVIHDCETNTITTPVSQLHLALCKMPSLKTLRVFKLNQGLPINCRHLNGFRVRSDMERSMFPPGSAKLELLSYELYLEAETGISLFTAIPSTQLRTLRLTGHCNFPSETRSLEHASTPITSFSSLQQLTMVAITGNQFDRHGFSHYFPDATNIHTFVYKHGHKLGFEIRDLHLRSLTEDCGGRLRKLVLLGCSRPTSAVIARCLRNLPVLEYFALSLITVAELRENFVESLPSSLEVFKLAIRQAWYAIPLIKQERSICSAIEERVLLRTPPLKEVCVDFRARLMEEDGRGNRWLDMAKHAEFSLKIGAWEIQEEV